MGGDGPHGGGKIAATPKSRTCAKLERQDGTHQTFGAWRSLVARLPWAQEVRGSNPRAPTKHPKVLSTKGGFLKKYRSTSPVLGYQTAEISIFCCARGLADCYTRG